MMVSLPPQSILHNTEEIVSACELAEVCPLDDAMTSCDNTATGSVQQHRHRFVLVRKADCWFHTCTLASITQILPVCVVSLQ